MDWFLYDIGIRHERVKWLRSTNDPSKAFCTVCSNSFQIDNGERSQVAIHEQGMFHIQHVKAQKGQ